MSYRDEANKVFASLHLDTISQRGFVLEIAARADAEIAKLRAALLRIAEGNLGPSPWQADYARVREVAREAIDAARKDIQT